ncbi:MAG: hypothetical protein B6D61_13420, partial [Bacteroidetes bacterium 4484_249]
MLKIIKLKILLIVVIPLLILAFEMSTTETSETMAEARSDKANSQYSYPVQKKGCLTCHEGIEPIREHNSKMMQAIYEEGEKMGDPNGCVVCHFGDPDEEVNKQKAHKELIRFPGSMWVNDKTCGKCHED